MAARPRNCIPGAVVGNSYQIQISYFDGRTESELRDLLCVDNETEIERFKEVWRIPFGKAEADPATQIPFIDHAGNLGLHSCCFVPAIRTPKGDIELSQLLLWYMASYSLGMLCRYFPSRWQHLLSQGLGSRLYPLLKAIESGTSEFRVLTLKALKAESAVDNHPH